jgi:hypothetical protein
MRTAFDVAHDGVRLAGGTVPHRLRNQDRHFTYAADGLWTIHNAGFLEDKRFPAFQQEQASLL